jgi:chromosomal replication initiation ATPase DnaA
MGREKGDQRILDSGDFVGDVLRKAEEKFESMTKKRMSLDEIIAIVANSTETSIEDLKSPHYLP